MRGKGPTPYEECTHLPMFIVHPDVRGGQETRALSAHIDILPTLLSFAGVSAGRLDELAGRHLPGKLKGVAGGKDLTTAFKTSGQPDLRKRGTLRMAVDGRYKFTRYFGPTQHHIPNTIDQLYENNDVELYDLQKDPGEMTNLAATKGQNQELVMEMNAKLSSVIKEEIGADNGGEMPDVKGISWALKIKDNQAILD